MHFSPADNSRRNVFCKSNEYSFPAFEQVRYIYFLYTQDNFDQTEKWRIAVATLTE